MVSNYIRGNDMPKLTPSKDCYQCNKANISKVYAWRYLKDHLFNTDYFNNSECKITFHNKYNFAFIYKNKIMSPPLISKVRFSGAKPEKIGESIQEVHSASLPDQISVGCPNPSGKGFFLAIKMHYTVFNFLLSL